MDENGEFVSTKNRMPVLAIAARNAEGEITAVQRIYLDAKTSEKSRFMKAAKLSSGIIKGSAAAIQVGKVSGRLYVAEGPETGASIAMADPKATVLVAFSVSNLGNLADVIKSHNPSRVIIAADNDGKSIAGNTHTRKTTENAVQKLRDCGLNAEAVYPKILPELKKTDWNDVLVRSGVESVQRQLGIASSFTRDISTGLHPRFDNIGQRNKRIELPNALSGIEPSIISRLLPNTAHHDMSNNTKMPSRESLLAQRIDMRDTLISGVHQASQNFKTPLEVVQDRDLLKEMEI